MGTRLAFYPYPIFILTLSLTRCLSLSTTLDFRLSTKKMRGNVDAGEIALAIMNADLRFFSIDDSRLIAEAWL